MLGGFQPNSLGDINELHYEYLFGGIEESHPTSSARVFECSSLREVVLSRWVEYIDYYGALASDLEIVVLIRVKYVRRAWS